MKRDYFSISDGNIKVLEAIPIMMKNKKYRKQLRLLTLDFMSEENRNGR